MHGYSRTVFVAVFFITVSRIGGIGAKFRKYFEPTKFSVGLMFGWRVTRRSWIVRPRTDLGAFGRLWIGLGGRGVSMSVDSKFSNELQKMDSIRGGFATP
jgi:hypothetical protein